MRRKAQTDSLPEINLVPMLDVMMSVLTFFIIITMSFSGNVIQNLENPTGNGGIAEDIIEGPLLIGLNGDGEIIYEGEAIPLAEMQTVVRQYRTQDPLGEIIFKADRNLPYQAVAAVLEAIADQGSDRISLTISQ
ncbi:MAG: ExbD/TolR family protein [Prochlorotrichaceae cyanobacterium]